jgi:LmbE family N-acetylglucosaminyl deacetylase
MPNDKTVLAIGAHYDDSPFGVPGLLLQAVRKHYRVVTLTLIGDYSNWPPAAGRHQEIVEGTKRIAQDYGVESRFLNYRSQQFDVTAETKRAVSEAVVDIAPDIAFLLWPDDTHPDHEVASRLSKVALRQAGRVLNEAKYRPPRRMYCYDNGPRHTIGFEPDTFIDVSDDWPRAIEWLGRLAALVKNEKFDGSQSYPGQDAKEALAVYRGKTAGVAYSEALKSLDAYPQEIL